LVASVRRGIGREGGTGKLSLVAIYHLILWGISRTLPGLATLAEPQVHVAGGVIESQGAHMSNRKPPMHGGMTKEEFEGLREDLQKLISEHPRAKFTILLLDANGNRTEDLQKATRYGLTAYEDDRLILEEMGTVVDGMMIKEQ
jgi:hypothetical protein